MTEVQRAVSPVTDTPITCDPCGCEFDSTRLSHFMYGLNRQLCSFFPFYKVCIKGISHGHFYYNLDNSGYFI